MIDDWYSAIKLPLNLKQFHQLPRNAAYKYEYIEGDAWLSPRPKNGRAVLNLTSFSPPIAEISGLEVAGPERITVRPLAADDWDNLPPLFAAAFNRVQPFASLGDKQRLLAAEDCMRHTRQSGDGAVIEPACFVAAAGDELAGTILITRPDDDALGDEPSRPHLTWIFVAPMTIRQGVGSALLDAAVRELQRQGCRECGARSSSATSRARSGTGGPASSSWRTAGPGGR